MLALISYVRYVDSKSKWSYVLSLVFGLLSILAKPMALSLPLVLFLCDWFKKRKLSPQMFFDKVFYFLYIIPIALLTFALNAREIHALSLKSFLIWCWSLTFYILKFVFPYPLIPLYDLPEPISFSNPLYVLPLFVILIMMFLFIRLKTHRWFIFAFLYYFFSIFFLLRYDQTVDISIVADRFMYLPSLGFCLMIGNYAQGSLIQLKNNKLIIQRAYVGLIIIIFVLFSYLTFNQCNVWKDSVI